MMSFRKHKKAVSPILSVLLMIAVAVAAALVTYAWVMGYLNFTTSKVGRAIQIQSIGKAGNDLKVYVQNVGDGTTTLANVFVEGVLQGSAALEPANGLLEKGDTGNFTVSGYFTGKTLPLMVHVKVASADGAFSEASQLFEP